MSQKTYTFLVTSNRKGETKNYTLPASLLKIILVLVSFVVVLVAAMGVDYLGLLLEAGENKRLMAENIRLSKQFKVIEGKVNALENSLERVKNFSTKLKLITDVDAEDRSLKLTMGADSKSIQQSTILQKSEVDKRDGVEGPGDEFFTDAPTDETKGELVREDFRNYSVLSIRIDKAIKDTQLDEIGVLDLWNSLKNRKALLRSVPNLKPVAGWFAAKFGFRMDNFSGKPVMHNGVDIAAPQGSSIRAPADGVVEDVSYDTNRGKILTIDHGYGMKTYYAHNSQIFVEIGQKVSRRDIIATVGSTGRSQGPHLYYEVRVHGVPVDPMTFILEE